MAGRLFVAVAKEAARMVLGGDQQAVGCLDFQRHGSKAEFRGEGAGDESLKLQPNPNNFSLNNSDILMHGLLAKPLNSNAVDSILLCHFRKNRNATFIYRVMP